MSNSLLSLIHSELNGRIESIKEQDGMLVLQVKGQNLIEVCETLKTHDDFGFTQLSDLCGMDYSTYGHSDWQTKKTTATGFSRGRMSSTNEVKQEKRFAVVYHLLSITLNERIRIKCYCDQETLVIPSITSIWSSADWYEREAFDMFGILFQGHTDLRRILTDYGFIGHPFRKDFPLEGNVEVRYDPDQQRVIYQPVTIENRVLVPRVIRDDNRFVDANQEEDNA